MGNRFQTKRTSVSGRLPNTTNSSNTSYIDTGELALNLTDGKMFSSNGTVSFEIGANLTNLAVTNDIIGNLNGTANNANNLNGQLASYYTNATNISTGTLDTARLPATANITTLINVGANVSINTTAFFVGNATVNSILTSSLLTVGSFSVNSTSVKITSNDVLTFNDSTTQNTAFRVYDSTGTRIA